MHARAWLPALVLLAVPLAAASYGGTMVTVDAPVVLEGRVDSSLPGGVASFLGASSGAPFTGFLTADEVFLTYLVVSESCSGLGLPGVPSECDPTGDRGTEEALLRDVQVALVKPVSAYKLIATTDRAYADTATFGETGRLIATTGPRTQLSANADALHLSGSEDGWSTADASRPLFQPVYDVEARSSELTTATAALRAIGGFELFAQGFQVRVTGTTEDGESFSETYDTAMPDSTGEAYRVLVLEVHEGDLSATGTAPFTAYAPADQAPASDVHDRVRFTAASGTLVEDGDAREIEGTQDLTLTGPLHLRLESVGEFDQPRLQYTVMDGLLLDGLPEEKDEPLPPAALAAAGAAGAGGAGLLLALAYFWPRLKYAAMLALLPMYTRIERDAVLEHGKRDELYELIRVTPGIHAHEIGEKANIGWGTTVYHLKLLENHGLIVSKKSGRYKRFFVNTGEYTKKKDVYGALRNETAKSVAQYIVDHPGTTQKEMCAALGIQPSLASWHVEKLEGVELVKRVKDGRMVRYFAGPAWTDLNVRVSPLGGGDAPAET